MKLVTYANRSLLVGASDADALMEYARLVGEHSLSEVVTLRALNPLGHEVVASFLLNSVTTLLTETATEVEGVSEPDNTVARVDLLDRILTLTEQFDLTFGDAW